MRHDVAGDPITGARWTRRTTEKIALELARLGICVCPNTVARLLKQLDFRLRANQKRISRICDPDRNAQFEYIAAQRESFTTRGLPIISVDAKKRELVGNFHNAGRVWSQEPVGVNDHDFPSDADGVAIPYGVYDLQANLGSLFVGTTYNTPDFAVANIARWWLYDGRRRYPEADHLLILADGGGSNGPTSRAWRRALQTGLCDRFGISVTVCHYPTSASKWNPIEHRMFSEISKNWAGRPLVDYDTVLNYARTTRTIAGLKVKAYLVTTNYPKGVKVTDDEIAAVQFHAHHTQPKRNYTISPQ